jgi:hypothetical protein
MGVKRGKVVAAEATARLVLNIIHLDKVARRPSTVIPPTNQVDGACYILAIVSVMN